MPSLLYADTSISSVYRLSLQNVFMICSDYGCGSAVSISKDTLLTAAHVVSVDVEYRVYSQVTQDQIGIAKVSNRDKENDIAYMSFKNPYNSNLTMLKSTYKIPMGTQVYVSGYPLKSTLRVTTGHYFGNIYPGDTRVGVTAPIIFGNSGGPVFIRTKEGYRIIGIVSALMGSKNIAVPHMGIIIPHTTILRGIE